MLSGNNNSLLNLYKNQSERIHRLGKEGSWIVLGQVAAVVGSLVLVRVLTEYLTPVQYGELALGMTVAGLMNQVVMGGVINGVGRFYSVAVEKQDLGGYLIASRRLLGYSILAVISIGAVLISGLIWLGHSQWMGLAVAAMGFSALSGCNSALNSIQNAARQRAIVAFHGGIGAWLKIGVGLIIILWMGASSTAVVLGYICATFIVTLSQLLFLRRTIPPSKSRGDRINSNWIRKIWSFSWPFSAWGIFTWGQQISDRWALNAFAGTGEVGQYAVLYQLGFTPISLATGMAVTFIAPIFYQRSGEATDRQRNAQVYKLSWQMAKLALIFTAVCFFATLTLHGLIFDVLVSESYRKNSNLLPWIVLAGGIFAAGQMLALKLMSEMKTAPLAIIKVTTALLAIGMNILGAIVAGAAGVVGAVVVFSCCYFIWMGYFARRVY